MTFELQPHLRGNLVELRPLAPADFDAVFRAASDPTIWEQHPEPDRYKPALFQRYFDGAIASGGAFCVIDRSTGRVIGCTRFCDLKPDESEVEIGWTFLERAYWGGAFNGEMKRLMIDHALRFVQRVVFVVGENNLRSQKALEKIGARFDRRAEAVLDDGSVRRNVLYVITRTSATDRRPADAQGHLRHARDRVGAENDKR